ncbi:hypothetical protein E2C01_021767 [Portunus trituberculatus]|uniref:Uncharacterized protein n=1 Tax=Portunus trituberculatus TaxID=210409 RepID=A0A5B7E5F0_PORTR|nr:hypothetical protein [Portunus trituberculatus]
MMRDRPSASQSSSEEEVEEVVEEVEASESVSLDKLCTQNSIMALLAASVGGRKAFINACALPLLTNLPILKRITKSRIFSRFQSLIPCTA